MTLQIKKRIDGRQVIAVLDVDTRDVHVSVGGSVWAGTFSRRGDLRGRCGGAGLPAALSGRLEIMLGMAEIYRT